MKSRPMVVLLLALLPGSLSIAQEANDRNPLTQLSGSIRELAHRVAPAVVEILVTGYATASDEAAVP